MTKQRETWRPRPDRDQQAKALKQQFARASAPYFSRIARRAFVRKWALPAALGVAAFTVTLYAFSLSPWPPGETVRHVLAAPNCSAAHAMNLAPARKGEPGYYRRHDADRDGVACERFPAR